MKNHISLLLCLMICAGLNSQVDPAAARLFNEAVVAFKEKNYEAAIESYGKAITLSPGYTKAHYNRAKAYMRVKNFKRALGDLNECTKADPTNVNAWKYKGYSYMQIKNYPGAINSYNKALEIDASLNDCRANRGIALMQEGKYKKAAVDLKQVLREEPDNGAVLFNLAVAQGKMKDTDAALITYGRLIKAGYKTNLAAKERAKILLNNGEYSSAINDLDRILDGDRAQCEDYYLRGYCKMKLDDLAGADGDFKKAIALNDQHKPSIQNKAYTSFKLEKYEEAVEDFSKVLEIAPGDKNTQLNRGLSSLKLKDYQSAFSDFSNVIQGDPDHAIAYYNRASASLGLKKNDAACNDMREAAKLGYEEAFNHIRQICADY